MSWRVAPQSNPSLWLRVALVGGLAVLGLLVAVIILIIRRPATPTVSLNPDSGPPGTVILVRGQNWPPNEALTISLARPNTTTGEEIGAIWTNPDSVFTFDFPFPTSGEWSTLSSVDVVARSLDGQTTARAPFTVRPVPGGVIVQPTGTRVTGTPPATTVIGTQPALTLPARTSDPTATQTPGPSDRVLGVVQSLALDLDGLTITPIEGDIRQIVTGANTSILDEAGRAIGLDEIPIGSVVEALGERDGDQLRATRVQVRAQPPTPRATLTPPPPSPTITVPPTQTPLIIVVTATPLPPTATGLPTQTPTRTPTPPVITHWRGEYYPNRDLSGAPLFVRNDEQVDFVWSRPPRSPDGRDLPDPWSARWTQRLRFDAGWYRFTAQADDGVRVWIDGNLIIDEWHASSGNQVYEQIVRLAAGFHTVRIEYFQAGGNASIRVTWEPSSFTGWRAEYWNTPDLSGASVFVRDEDRVFHDWSPGSPDPRIPAANWSARYTRRLYFDEGLYRFTVTVDDGARLWVDGVLIVDAWRDQGVTTYTADYRLTAGDHDLRLDYYNRTGRAVIQLGWTRIPPTTTPTLTRTATAIIFPTATRTFTPTLTPMPTITRTPTVTPTPTTAPITATPTLTIVPPTNTSTVTATAEPATATVTATIVPLTPTLTVTTAPPTPTASATTAPPTSTVTATPTRTVTVRPTSTVPPGDIVRPWQATDFPLAGPSNLLESHTGRIANLVWTGIVPRCFAFDLQEGAILIPVMGHSQAVQAAPGLDLDPNQIISPICDALPPDGSSVRVWGARLQPGGPLVALRIEAATRPPDPLLGPTALYERRFILDTEFDEAAAVLVNTTLWVRTTVAVAPSLVRDSEALTAAFQARGLAPTASILLRGEVPRGESSRLDSITAWLFNGSNAYEQVYPGR